MNQCIIYDHSTALYLKDQNTQEGTPHVTEACVLNPIAAQFIVNGHTVGMDWVGADIIPLETDIDDPPM